MKPRRSEPALRTRSRPAFAPRRAAGTIRLQGAGQRAIEIGYQRLIVIGALFVLAFLVLAGRLIDLATGEAVTVRGRPIAQAAAPQPRADIVDRNGVVLATSLATVSLYARPALVPDAEAAVARLATVLPDLDAARTLRLLRSNRRFVWIKRKLSPRAHRAVLELGIPGLDFRREYRRVYPQGALAGHVLGYVDVDNRGLAGIERHFDDRLRDRQDPVQVSLDLRVQHALRHELGRGMATFSAHAAVGLVLDVRNGEILALVSLPDFDPNRPGAAPAGARFNRATLGVYEMGSTFKSFTIALALDSGVINLRSAYDTTQPLHLARYVIRDDHPRKGRLSVPEIFVYSSNIGAAQIAMDVGPEAQRAFLDRLGLLSRPTLELPEIGTPLVPERWRQVEAVTISYGYGLAVSPVQLARGIAALVNGGVLPEPTLVKRAPGTVPAGQRVISEQTSRTMRALMRRVVEQGTGSRADARGYLVGGKTGTARKAGGRSGGYRDGALLSSFVGVFPVDAPRYLVLAILDEPTGTEATHGFAGGGWTAAPITRAVITRIAPLLGVMPTYTERKDGELLAAAGG